MERFSELYLSYQDPKLLKGQPLLWPVWVWSVHVPTQRRQGLNVLAHAVLALHATGLRDEHWIAEHLGVEPDLVLYIVTGELVPNRWLDGHRRITEEGQKLLVDGADGPLEQQAGHLFQSAESGELWPRFRSKLTVIDPTDRREDYPRFLRDRDSGQTLRPFLLNPQDRHPPVQPDIDTVLKALRLDRVARHQRRQRDEMPLESDDISTQDIEFIDQTPRPAWLLCQVYRNENSDQPWLVSDPLGQSRAAAWMRQEVYQASRRVNPLARHLAKYLGEPEEALDWETYRQREEESVRWELLAEFPEIGFIPGLEDALIRLLRARKTVEASGKKPREEEIATLILEAQKVLELCCQWCLKEKPLQHPQRRLPRGVTLTELRKGLSLACPELKSSFVNEFRVQPRKVFDATIKHRGSLRQYLAGVLLSLVDHPDHPFRSLAADEDLMLKILKLSHDRDSAGHSDLSSMPKRIQPDQAIDHADTALEAVRRLTKEI